MPNSILSTTERRVPGGLLRAGILAGILWSAATPLRADLPAAQAEEKSSLTAAQAGDWSSAIPGLTAAQGQAWDDPALMFNLGLANERAGDPAAAILWWRAYLVADPRAANAGAVRREQGRLAAGLEAAARRKFREAVTAALRLSGERPHGTGRSLRRAAFDDILTQAYQCGLVALGDEISARARVTTPGERESEAVVTARKSRGLWGLTQAFDERHVRALRRELGGAGVNWQWDQEAAAMYAALGEPAEAWKCLAPYGGAQLRRSFDGLYSETETVVTDMYEKGGGDEADRVLVRLEQAPGFDPKVFNLQVRLSEEAFWNGARTLARRMAAEALAYLERGPGKNAYLTDYDANRLLADALAGQWDAMEIPVIGIGLNYRNLDDRWIMANEVAAVTAAAAGNRAGVILKDLADALARHYGLPRDEPGGPVGQWVHEENPILDVATELVHGKDTLVRAKVAAWAQNSNAPAGVPDPAACLKVTLQLAVAFGRTDLALAAARGLADGYDTATQLRLLERKAGYRDRRRIDSFLTELRGSRRPPSREQERELCALTWQAQLVEMVLAYEYAPMPKDLKSDARESPGRLPGDMAYYGAMDHVGALVWRAE